MILPRFILIFTMVLPALSTPNLAGAVARIEEARARGLANRVRVRHNSEKLMAQLTSTRAKRQQPSEVSHLEKDAEALHSHSHFHHLGHHHGGFHNAPFVPAQVVAPGVNLNINQNQGFSAQTLPLHQGVVLPQHHGQVFPQHHVQGLPQHHGQVLPQYHGQVLPQHQNQFINQHQTQVAPQHSLHGSSIIQSQTVLRQEKSDEVREEIETEAGEFLPNHQSPTVFDNLRESDFQSQQRSLPILPNQEFFHELTDSEFQDLTLAMPYLLDVPEYRRDYYNYGKNKRSLGEVQRKTGDFLRNLPKRSIPLMRLVSDPNMKLDVPKTIENFGTVTKNAFEDEKAPLYHLKHLLGSTRNTVLSAMKIPPQNLVIPSDYEIVKTKTRSERVGGINPSIVSGDRDGSEDQHDSSTEFGNTFRRVGHLVRDSIKSGQDTASHIGDIAHDARNILHTSKFSTPRLIAPFSQIPALQNRRRNKLSPALLITPRIIDLAQERLGAKHETRPDLVKLGEIMDAVGVSNPNSPKVDLRKIILNPRERSDKLAKLLKQDADVNVGDTLHTLENAKMSVGAKNLRDFLVKMKNEFASAFGNQHHDSKPKKHKSKQKKQEEEVTKFVETLFNGSKNKDKLHETVAERLREVGHQTGVSRSEMEEYVKLHCNNFLNSRSGFEENNSKLTGKNEENVGLYLPMDLLKPFMGRASKSELKTFFHANGVDNPKLFGINDEDTVGGTNKVTNMNEETLGDVLEYLKQRNETREETKPSEDSVLGSINPLMFERLYHETLRFNNNTVEDPQTLFARPLQESTHVSGNQTVGTGMAISGPMLKPFMGKIQPDALEEFLDTYNQDDVGFDEIKIH